MRLTAEQFNQRKENRITGAYEIKPVNAFRKGRPHCENCCRETEFLFDGVMEVETMLTEKESRYQGGTRYLTETISARVCQRCRPKSNLEAMEEHATAGQRVLSEYRKGRDGSVRLTASIALTPT